MPNIFNLTLVKSIAGELPIKTYKKYINKIIKGKNVAINPMIKNNNTAPTMFDNITSPNDKLLTPIVPPKLNI